MGERAFRWTLLDGMTSLGTLPGGSTYSFDVWPSHPLAGEVQATLSRLRTQLGELWDRVEAHNRAHGVPPEYERVTVYAGQSSLMQHPSSPMEGDAAAEGNNE